MKFLLVEILIWLIAASILGLVVGWLFKSVFASRRLSRVNSDWEGQYSSLKASSNKELGILEQSAKSLETDNETLQSKVGSLSAMVKSMETALLKANAENKTLNTTVSSQQLTINEIRVESENLIKKQSSMQMALNTLEKSKEQEFKTLSKQLSDSQSPASVDGGKTNESGSANESATSGKDSVLAADPVVSRLAPVLNTTGNADSSDIDQKIRSLNEQRDRLNREREDLFNQEQHFAAQLTRGDDTEAYLDQTIRIDEDLTSTIQSDTSELHRAAATPADNLNITRDESNAVTLEASEVKPGVKSKSLWDKFKSSVNRPTEKP